MKRLLVLLTALCMILALAACGKGSTAGTATQGNKSVQTEDDDYYDGKPPITRKPGQSLKILARTSNYTNVDIANAEIVKKVIENAGITVNWQLVDHGNYSDAVTPMLLSGNVDADIIQIPDKDQNQTYIKSGLFVPLDEYFDYMPNFKAWLEKNPVIKAEITADDGHIYYRNKRR
ncbi:ABC-type sugar transport system, periplasmic component [Thermoclostridium stercorarium subsp. stercorarium DSM 8532]|uniref:ABC-type sugar transport system, periplasmic component n=1 Tax=Thermoclostridium stercorarium (strain ATCC 35414 / DSM 8532 / NCIMB 11754) TaxID=1121335 RepID=L7VNR1_THES1|nr:extracellular solute-binding protein [Thermoclostridium stercorarium]AGC67148.1 ABC-type sugar transport system, periplasmic component [Thermoclostridium stercorarium subsp. stercorarium DSM 8532]AGI38226.1 ABC transporter periplasmic subunit [Thermoclostridium stercorarium subsp. stercorarium DSM 8532]